MVPSGSELFGLWMVHVSAVSSDANCVEEPKDPQPSPQLLKSALRVRHSGPQGLKHPGRI